MSEAAHDPKDPDYLLHVIRRQNGAIRKLIAERDELRALLEANGQKRRPDLPAAHLQQPR
jgi:hypothetical protein